MTLSEAVVLAIVEGLTEFLPVSSTGHMIIASSIMGIASDPFTKSFTVAIQFGAILSVIMLYWRNFFQSIDFYFKLFVAFLPAALLGFLLNDFIDQLLERVEVVAITLILGGIVFLFIDKLFSTSKEEKEVNYGAALKIGLFQTISMIPGVSRSAATIIGGLTQGLTRKSAAEFSFFLAVPTMFAATLYKLYKYFSAGYRFEQTEVAALAIGNLVAFVVAALAIRYFIQYLTKHGFKIFGYYRIVLGVILIALYLAGVELSIA